MRSGNRAPPALYLSPHFVHNLCMESRKIRYSEQFDSSEDAWFWLYRDQKNFDSEIGTLIQELLLDLQGQEKITINHVRTVQRYGKLGRIPLNKGKQEDDLKLWDEAMCALDTIYVRNKVIKYLSLIK